MLLLFRIIAILEGISYLSLFAFSMPLKYWAGIREPNLYIGYIHGGLFILYILIGIAFALERQWGLRKMSMVFLASLLPFGTFYLDAQVLKPLSLQKTQ